MAKPLLLLDENISIIVAKQLRKDGFDVASISEDFPSASDETVLEKARRETRIIVTQDSDFGLLIYLREADHCGVIFFRLKNSTPDRIYELLSSILQTHGNRLIRRFTVISGHNVRIR